MVANPESGREVAIKGDGKYFPARVSIHQPDPKREGSSLWSVYDDDLDGVPDRRVDWVAREFYQGNRMNWTKAKPRGPRRAEGDVSRP